MSNPETSADSFMIFSAAYPPEVQPVMHAARDLILEALPGCSEMVDIPSKITAYGYGSKYADLVTAIAPYPKHVNLMFSRGVDLPDPERLLEGSGKKARHVHLRSVEDVHRPAVRSLLGEALALYRRAKKG